MFILSGACSDDAIKKMNAKERSLQTLSMSFWKAWVVFLRPNDIHRKILTSRLDELMMNGLKNSERIELE